MTELLTVQPLVVLVTLNILKLVLGVDSRIRLAIGARYFRRQANLARKRSSKDLVACRVNIAVRFSAVRELDDATFYWSI